MELDWNHELAGQLDGHGRQVIHHGAEIALLRDLYLRQVG
jgi:hypothetical protein